VLTSFKKFIAFENAYHGDTFGGMSVGARNVFNNAFENLLFDVIHIPLPDEDNIEQIKEFYKKQIKSKKDKFVISVTPVYQEKENKAI
jgi:adenosylmethionine-8-amino-7-oxononanoate aminotransferase